MAQTVLERAGEQFAETVERASHATTSLRSRLHDGFDEAKAVARRGVHATEELLDDTRLKIKKHPVTSVTGAFVFGLLLGTLAGWMIRRR